ncbi:Ku protein [Thermosulfurimonas sp.]|uniref:Ku protein n=1 Tax=Thermosulfurimonas sp. TaxID=2080236 RepID=UPI0034419072
MKALWKGTLTVALLSIPVKLYTAVRKRPLEFHLLHRSCNTPLKYERYCPSCRREIPWEEVVRGYEYEKTNLFPWRRKSWRRFFLRSTGPLRSFLL